MCGNLDKNPIREGCAEVKLSVHILNSFEDGVNATLAHRADAYALDATKQLKKSVPYGKEQRSCMYRPIAAIGSGQGRIGISKRGGGDHT